MENDKAEDVAGFVPTRQELLVIAKYWAQQAIETEFTEFLYAQTGSTERQHRTYAWNRVNRIGDLLGNCVGKGVEEVYEKYGKAQDPRFWQIFLHGTPEERQAVQDEIQKRLEEQTEHE